MGAYMYAINVNYDRETKRSYRSKRVESPLTVEKLQKIVGDNAFTISESDEQWVVVNWYITQPETDEEMKARINKGEKYNKAREEFLSKQRRKV